MVNLNSSCAVASPSKTQLRNSGTENATMNATTSATPNLLALSMRVLGQHCATTNATSNATSQLHELRSYATSATGYATYMKLLPELRSNATTQTRMVDTFSRESCAVAFPKGRNYATRELAKLIQQVSINYGGDNVIWLNDYINEVINSWSHDLDKAFISFGELATQSSNIQIQKANYD